MKLADIVSGRAFTDDINSKNSRNSNSKTAKPNNANISINSKNSRNSRDNTSILSNEEDNKIVSLTPAVAEVAVHAVYDRQSPLPFIGKDGSLMIPFDSAPRFHWWTGGQSARETETEVKRWVH